MWAIIQLIVYSVMDTAEKVAVIQLIAHSVINTTAHSGSNTAYSA